MAASCLHVPVCACLLTAVAYWDINEPLLMLLVTPPAVTRLNATKKADYKQCESHQCDRVSLLTLSLCVCLCVCGRFDH